MQYSQVAHLNASDTLFSEGSTSRALSSTLTGVEGTEGDRHGVPTRVRIRHNLAGVRSRTERAGASTGDAAGRQSAVDRRHDLAEAMAPRSSADALHDTWLVSHCIYASLGHKYQDRVQHVPRTCPLGPRLGQGAAES